MNQSGTTKLLLSESKVLRTLLANAEKPLEAMLQFINDKYIEDNLLSEVAASLICIKALKRMLDPEEQKPIKKWEQIPLIR